RCVDNGTACGGPYDVYRQSELGMAIERHHMLPIPDSWLPKTPTTAKFKVTSERKKSKLSKDEKNSWDFSSTAADGGEKKLYTYFERIDAKTNQPSEKTFTAYKGTSITLTFKQDAQSNSLAFTDPVTSASCRWVSNRPISTINGERLDF
ncbi:hypothetical protein EK21DRAFT_29294, partial [Setomelanomma holmii]